MRDMYTGNDQSLSETQNGLPAILSSVMDVKFITTPRNYPVLVHDKPLGLYVKWVEFDQSGNDLALVLRDDSVVFAGLDISENLKSSLLDNQDITVVEMKDGIDQKADLVPLILTGMVN